MIKSIIQILQNQKNNDKQNKKYNKDLDKWNNKFYKIFHKTLISDPAFRHHIIDITPFNILDTLIPPSDNLPLPRLIHLKLLQSHQLANHSYNNPKLDLNLLPNLPNKPTTTTTTTTLLLTTEPEKKTLNKDLDNDKPNYNQVLRDVYKELNISY